MATPLPRITARFTLAEVAAATAGDASGDAAQVLTGVSTDSRALAPGGLFIALRGDRFDGHAHVAAALAGGAGAALVERSFAPLAGPVVRVDDTLRALGDLARAHLRRHRAQRALPLVAVSGAVGKTTTKELLAAALGAVFGPCLAPEGNLNNLVGAPVTALTLGEHHRAAVIECGSNARGEIARIAAMAEPDVALCLNADIAHAEGVGSVEDVADEEGALFAYARRAVLGNADEPVSCARMSLARNEIGRWTFGVAPGATVRLASRVVEPDGFARLELTLDPSRVRLAGGPLVVRTRLLGPAVATNFAAALGAVAALGVDEDGLRRAARALGEVAPVPGRLVPRALRGALVLDDTYNASPRAVRAALAAARELADARGARLVVALGDMLELGAWSDAAHAEAVAEVAQARAAVLVTCGAAMTRAAATGAGAAEVVRVGDSVAAGEALRARVTEGDVVLVKGSRGTRMERAVGALED
jgi:UDP-N-acetylmuramoyl-tripeptide--D-alanyl-D-alanine ligase